MEEELYDVCEASGECGGRAIMSVSYRFRKSGEIPHRVRLCTEHYNRWVTLGLVHGLKEAHIVDLRQGELW